MKTPRSNRFKFLVTAAVIFLLLCTAGVMIVVFSFSPFNKYIVATGLPDPDSAYQTGTLYGYDVYIWECYQGKRIVVYRYSSEMTAGAYSREETACGGVTGIEEKLAGERKRERGAGGFW